MEIRRKTYCTIYRCITIVLFLKREEVFNTTGIYVLFCRIQIKASIRTFLVVLNIQVPCCFLVESISLKKQVEFPNIEIHRMILNDETCRIYE